MFQKKFSLLTILISIFVINACSNSSTEVVPDASNTSNNSVTTNQTVVLANLEAELLNNEHFMNVHNTFEDISNQVTSDIEAMTQSELQNLSSAINALQTNEEASVEDYLSVLGLDSTYFHTQIQFINSEIDKVYQDISVLSSINEQDLINLFQNTHQAMSSDPKRDAERDACYIAYNVCRYKAASTYTFGIKNNFNPMINGVILLGNFTDCVGDLATCIDNIVGSIVV